MPRSPRHESTTATRFAARLAPLAFAVACAACAGAHEEPPAPPPPPIDPSAFSGPPRTPAPVVDLRADLDGGDLWFDADVPDSASAPPIDAGPDARPATGAKRKH